MRIELLFWAGCPSHPQALRELRAALEDVGLDADSVIVREVTNDGDAASERFIGSPTIRIDDEDVQPEPREPVGLTCRVYRRRDGRISPTPDPEDVRDALRRALARAHAHAAPANGHEPTANGDEPTDATATRPPTGATVTPRPTGSAATHGARAR